MQNVFKYSCYQVPGIKLMASPITALKGADFVNKFECL